MAQRIAIRNVLTTCGFTVATERNFTMGNEGLDCWIAFTLIIFDDLATIRNFAQFTISALKLRCLIVLKFWIDDKIRMNEPHVASQFTQDTITTYNRLCEAFVAARDHGARIHGPQFNTNDWSGFETGTIACLGSIQGSGGVPLSYILRNDVLCPPITIASPRETKIFWNAPFLGPDFDADNHCIWTYLVH